MIDANTLAYDFDEEGLGFSEPETPEGVIAPSEDLSGAQRMALGLVAFGAVFLLVQAFNGPLNGSWAGFLLSFGPMVIGAPLLYWLQLRDTQAGIKHDGTYFRSLLARGAMGWAAGIGMTLLYVLIYWYPEVLGERGEGGNVGLVGAVDPLAQVLVGGPASRWFLYGVLYTSAILVFASRMAMKYRHNRYQLIRTASVTFFQLGFAFLLPNLIIKLNQPYYEFNGVWPLKYDYLFPDKISYLRESGALGQFMIFWSLLAILVLTPTLTYFFGKRWYCSWVCGCGGLAETLGDPWRQNSNKSERAWKAERIVIHSVLVAVFVVTGMLWVNHLTDGGVFGQSAWTVKKWYGFYIGAIFSGIAGVGFYPILGSRFWCRFGCPMAAILGLFQRIWSRFRITTNGGQCMSCGNCSTYCEMGIDVRAYAQRGENIVRASCVGCGVCSAVCPRGVLKLESGATIQDRFEGSEDPLGTLMSSLKSPEIYERWTTQEPTKADAP